MGKEIEHKFLLLNNQWRNDVVRSEQYSQGYLATNDRASIRVRVAGHKAWLNLKGATLGVARHEFEYEIPVDEANEILETLCARPFISKTRHFVPAGEHTWEVDEFHGENEGLVVAEIEVSEEGEHFHRPDWVGEEVSGDSRYYNVCLVENPYKNW